MELFLRTLLKLSLLGSALALALTALRPLLRGRVSRRVSYYLWLLVLLRLCVPVGLDVPVPAPEAEAPPRQTVQTAPVRREDGLSPIAPETGPSGAEAGPSRGQAALAPTQAVLAPQARRPAEWWKNLYLWGAVWWLGAVASAAWFTLGYLRVSGKVLRAAVPASGEARAVLRALDPGGRVRLMESPAVDTPLLLGAVRPTIVLPPGVTDPARLRDILAHELTHVRRHDLLFKWSAAIVTSFHWFNPVMPLVRREIGRNCELACDEAVMKDLTEGERRHYGETLLALAAHAPRGLGPLAATLCEEKKQLKERLYCIVKFKRSGPMVVFLSLVLAAVVGACALVTGVKTVTPDAPEPPPEEGPQDDDTEPPVLYELNGGLTLAIPADIADRLTVFFGDTDQDGYAQNLISVYEKQSYEASMSDGGLEGMGYLFGITRYTSEQYEEYLAGDDSGISPFATDGAYYYMHTFATDVQFYRNSDSYENVDFTPWYELEERVDGILDDLVTRNGLEPYSSLERYAQDLYQDITKETSPDSRDYDFTVQVRHNRKTDEFHITGENGINVAFVGNYLTLSYIWEEANAADWWARDYLGTVLTLTSADGKCSIRCRSADGIVELVRDGETRYARVWDPETPEDPDPHLRYSLFSFLMIIPDDAYVSQRRDFVVDGSLSPAEAARQLSELWAEHERNTPDWLDWKPLDFQVESAEVFDVYNGEDLPNFCFDARFYVQLDDPNYMRWQAGAGLDAPVEEGPFAGYYRWGLETFVMKNSEGDWYIADSGTGGYSVEFPGWTWSYGVENYIGNAPLEELADLFFLTEGDTHEYRLPVYICERPAEELAGLNDLLSRRTEAEARDLCRALAAYLNAGFGESNHDTLRSVEDLNALLSPAYQAYTADVPPYGEE